MRSARPHPVCTTNTARPDWSTAVPWAVRLAVRTCRRAWLMSWLALGLAAPSTARASMFQGETLDTVADVLSWVVLVVAPLAAIVIFWLVHILPEKIAEKRKHPQAKAIQVLCLLSLAFGGLLWPLAWLWAYTKPVLHKLAYGTDVAEEYGHEGHADADEALGSDDELQRLRRKVAALELQLTDTRRKRGDA